MVDQYAELMDEIAELYEELRAKQYEVVFGSKTEMVAERMRKQTLALVTGRLHKILAKRGDPRATK